VLEAFFQMREGRWTHKRVEAEKARCLANAVAYQQRATKAAEKRWAKPTPSSEPSQEAARVAGTASQQPAASPSPQQPPPPPPPPPAEKSGRSGEKAAADKRHMPFVAELAAYWKSRNQLCSTLPWQGRDGKALKQFLEANPLLTREQFRQLLANRARSAVAHGDRVYLWIENLTRFQEVITVYNKPASAATRRNAHRNAPGEESKGEESKGEESKGEEDKTDVFDATPGWAARGEPRWDDRGYLMTRGAAIDGPSGAVEAPTAGVMLRALAIARQGPGSAPR
jgi:hypothetical protein